MATVPEVPGVSVETAQAEADTALATKEKFRTMARVFFEKTNAKGDKEIDFDIANEKEGHEIETKKKYGKDEFPVTAVEFHSFKGYAANNYAGMRLLTPDEKEAVKMYNRGLSTKQDNYIRKLLSETVEVEDEETGEKTKDLKFKAQEQPYDLKDFLATESRTRQTAEEKMLEQLETMNVPPSVLKQFFAALDRKRAQMALAPEEDEEE